MNKNNPLCPHCKSSDTCPIFWGYPGNIEEFSKLVDEKKISPGGCCISDNDPLWHCNNCQIRWGKRSEKNEMQNL